MKKETIIIAALLSGMLSIALAVSANATPRHKQQRQAIVCDMRGCSDQASQARAARAEANAAVDANGGAVVSRRPQGCPHAFCGCEASLYVFGKIRPELNLASNWIRKFPRTSPAPGMAAARSGHVMVLMSHVEGNNWLVHDGNSGGGLTREHIRSISGLRDRQPAWLLCRKSLRRQFKRKLKVPGTGVARPVSGQENRAAIEAALFLCWLHTVRLRFAYMALKASRLGPRLFGHAACAHDISFIEGTPGRRHGGVGPRAVH